jgi:3-oxoacyl-ACP reductase-like protein
MPPETTAPSTPVPQAPPTPPAPVSSAPAQPAPASQPMKIPEDPKKYLEFLFDFMIKYDSSDIYLTFGEEPTIRVYGEARRIQ